MPNVSSEQIEAFLSGSNDKKYVVGIEAGYNEPSATLIVNDPNSGKSIEKYPFQPFLWFKHDITYDLYEGKRLKTIEATQKYGVKIKKLKTKNDNGFTPSRLENGFIYLATCKNSYNDLINFFKHGGVDIFSKEYSKLFFTFTPVEQFMIQTGIRMFKGMDDYNDVHRFQFDIETEGLFGDRHAIFQIGVRDNRGFEHVLEVEGNTPQERRDSEREIIIKFFQVIDMLKPDVITGYNSDSFDWKFMVDRCNRLSIPIEQIAMCLDRRYKLKRKPSILKLGNEMEAFNQTFMWGYNIIDIAHAVRRAQAINSNIKSWGLKYITQYSEVAKKNRVYVPGDKIHTVWTDKVNKYAFNDSNGDWYRISDRMELKDGYKEVMGNYIIQRYLLDDLWETEQIDTIFNQASFLIAKLLPTTYSRTSTMGTASQWKLIMAAWSYENGLAIPETEKKREFTGGLSRLLELGYNKNVVKFDYAALYPKDQLTHDIFPDLDISGVMKGLLTYIVDTRDKFKFLTDDHKQAAKKIQKEIDENKDKYSEEKLKALKEELTKHKSLQGLYDKKQLPLKILANSWFGAYGAPYIFNWGDTDCAEETTCVGRQYLRLMVRHFTENYGFKPLVGDTDGFNFQFPDNIENIRYTAKGSHWKTKNNAGAELSGLEAILAEFNENFMIGRMGLDIDEICTSTINFSRKNYATDIDGKVKLVGNSIKSKKMPVYIEDFLSKAIRLLLDGNGSEFISYYYEYVDKIYNYNIPLVKIASKSKVKSTMSEYKKKATKKNKAGNPMPKQAHMELAIKNDIEVNLGDTIYYVNTGTAKSHGDLKTIKKENGAVEIQLNCKLIDISQIESNMEMINEIDTLNKILSGIDSNEIEKITQLKASIQETEEKLLREEYNVAKYLEAFNKKVKPLLVCFHPDIRNKILLSIKKDRKTKLEKLSDRNIFTEEQCILVSGMPNEEKDQDKYYEDLMVMEDKEIKFWDKVNKTPIIMSEEEWDTIRTDYHRRKQLEREAGIEQDRINIFDAFRRLEVDDLKKILNTFALPESVITIALLDEEGYFVSRKWGERLCVLNDIFNYEEEALQRALWYQMTNTISEDRFDKWAEHLLQESNPLNIEKEVSSKIEDDKIPVVKEKVDKFIIKKNNVEEDEEDDEEEDDEVQDEFLPELQKLDYDVEQQLGNTVKLEQPPIIKKENPIKENKVEDEWGF